MGQRFLPIPSWFAAPAALLFAALWMLGGAPPPKEFTGGDGAPMALVPAGRFRMGSTPKEIAQGMALCRKFYPKCRLATYTIERPRRSVYLKAFYIDRFEVTNELFLKAGMVPAQDHGPQFNQAKQPIVGVTWSQAKEYCEKFGKRLPTEAEWEKAARGDGGRMFPWGEMRPNGKLANFCDATCTRSWKAEDADDGHPQSAPVGSFPAGVSPYGVHDMAGNVWEWVADWYQSDAYRSASVRNPKGPMRGSERVMRGGGWGNHPGIIRSAFRLGALPTAQYSIVGFRCARDAP